MGNGTRKWYKEIVQIYKVIDSVGMLDDGDAVCEGVVRKKDTKYYDL